MSAGKLASRLIPIEPSGRVVVAVFPALISEQQRDQIASALNDLYKSAGKRRPLALAVFNGAGFDASGPYATQVAWRKAVRQALTEPDRPTPELSAALLYSIVAASSAALGGDWSTLIIAGPLPELPPAAADYAAAWLAPKFCSQKLRVSYWNSEAQQSSFWKSMANLTGGRIVESPADALDPAHPEAWAQAVWPAQPFESGFLLSRGKLSGNEAIEIPVIAAAPTAPLPDIETYVEWQGIDRDLSELAREKEPGDAQSQRALTLAERALAINARDTIALRVASNSYERSRDDRSAAGYLEKLAKIEPGDANLQAELGHWLFTAGDPDRAEPALLFAREHKGGDATVSLELARIHLSRKDDPGALPFLDETLAADPRNTELWYTRADTADRLGDKVKLAGSLEKALALDPSNLPRRTSLVRLYIERGAPEDALRHIRIVTAALPPDAATRREFAQFLDELKRPEEALPVWLSAVEADPSNEQAHYRVASILLDSGKHAESVTASEEGLKAAPNSSRLYILKADALERQKRYFDARRTLRNAAQTVQDPDLLTHLAVMEDTSGTAPQVYIALSLARDKARLPESAGTLERALEVSVRDGDAKAAAFFRRRLAASGNPAVLGWLTQSAEKNRAEATVPGGLAGLAFITRARFQSAQNFFAEYCRTLVERLDVIDPKERNTNLESIRAYFRELGDLKSMAKAGGKTAQKGGENITTISVSLANKAEREKSERILDILGWKLKTVKDGIKLEAGEGSAKARRQETASALALDEAGMQESLEAGKSFEFEIPDETAPVLLSESTWMQAFFPKAKFKGGFAEALANDVRMAKTYAALSMIGSRLANALISGADLRTLAEKHADQLYFYGSAFALQGDRAAVPGGPAADAIWEKMAGASPSQAGKFFHALLEKDDGHLLAFFATLGELDVDHQRFLTRSARRTARYYELFQTSGDISTGAAKSAHNTSFAEFLRELPLDSELHVLFPGGPEVWTAVKGNSISVSQSGKLAKRLSRVTAPDVEDEILDRLARTHYMRRGQSLSELESFRALVQIDEHRPEPLDGPSALMLAENYNIAKSVYPYFAVLTALEQPQFDHFFALIAKLNSDLRPESNVILGELHSLIELISLAQQSGALQPKSAADLFDRVCTRFGKAGSAAGYTEASLESARELLRLTQPNELDPDRALESMLIGSGGPVWFELSGAGYDIDPYAARSSAYRKVLAAQKVTSLKALLEFDDELQNLAHNRGSAASHVARLESLRAGLLTVPLPKGVKVEELDRKLANDYDEPKVASLVARLKQRVSKKKPDPNDWQPICEELEGLISPQVKVALSGAVYAHFLSPNDLLVSQDPLLLRKHRFVELSQGQRALLTPAHLEQSSKELGSYIEGGFASFPVAAGQVAMSGAMAPDNTQAVAEAQMASLRATDWSKLNDSDLLHFGLRLRLAREWVLHAGTDSKLFAALDEDTAGLLSPIRRGELLDAITAHDWNGAFRNLTLSDLYSLSVQYLTRYSTDAWQSPVVAALRRDSVEPDDPRLAPLGGVLTDVLGCSHPHLEVMGAYEEYERLLLPSKIAQRAAELKLYLADFAGREGIPPAALNALSEPIAFELIKKMQMTALSDWRNAQAAFARLDDTAVIAAIPGAK